MIVFTNDLVESVICVWKLVRFLALPALCVGLNLVFDPIHLTVGPAVTVIRYTGCLSTALVI